MRGRVRAAPVIFALAVAMGGAACTPAGPAGSGPPGGLATLHIDPTPTPRPTATPPPATPSLADAAVAGLVALAQNDATTYQATITGRSRHSADILPVEGTMQVAGADSRLVADFDFPEAGGRARVEVRAIDGDGWLSIQGEPFTAIGSIAADEAPNPLALIEEAADVTVVSDEPDANGRYTVEFESMVIHPGFIPAVNLTEEQVNRTQLTLLIDERGRPVSGTWELTGQGRISRQLQAIVMELELVFSKLGAEISIGRP